MDTRDIADERVVETVRKIERVGQEKYTTFVKRTTSLSDPIKKNKLSLFRCQKSNTKKPSIDKQTITSLKKSCSLFSQLYVSCQVRNGDLEDFVDMQIKVSLQLSPRLVTCGQETSRIFCPHSMIYLLVKHPMKRHRLKQCCWVVKQ